MRFARGLYHDIRLAPRPLPARGPGTAPAMSPWERVLPSASPGGRAPLPTAGIRMPFRPKFRCAQRSLWFPGRTREARMPETGSHVTRVPRPSPRRLPRAGGRNSWGLDTLGFRNRADRRPEVRRAAGAPSRIDSWNGF